MKSRLFKIGVVNVMLTAPSILFSQQKESSVGVYFGLNEYFQGTPIIRGKYYSDDLVDDVIRVQKNIGMSFIKRQANRFIEFDVNFAHSFHGDATSMNHYPVNKPLPYFKHFFNFELVHGREFKINDNMKLDLGAGGLLKIGVESFVMDIILLPERSKARIERLGRLDPGLVLRSRLNYSITRNFSLYSSLNFSSILYIADQKTLNQIQSYDEKRFSPTRFDLSLRFGVFYKF